MIHTVSNVQMWRLMLKLQVIYLYTLKYLKNIAVWFEVSPVKYLINNITAKYLQRNLSRDGGR